MKSNFLKVGINFDKKYSNLQQALSTRKTKVIQSLLDGTKNAYKRKKRKRAKFNTEYSDHSADEGQGGASRPGKPLSDNEKSNYEYESSADTILDFDSHSMSHDDMAMNEMPDDDCVSLMNVQRRNAAYVQDDGDDDRDCGVDGVNMKLKKTKKKKEKMIKKPVTRQVLKDLVKSTLDDVGSPKNGTTPKLVDKSYIEGVDAKMKQVKGVGDEIKALKDKVKRIMKEKKDKIKLSFKEDKQKKKKKDKKRPNDGRLDSIKASKTESQRFITFNSPETSSVDTEYLDEAIIKANIFDNPLNNDNICKDTSILDQIKQKLDAPKQLIKPIDTCLPSLISKEIAADIKNKKDLLHKHALKANLSETLREYILTKEKQKTILEDTTSRQYQINKYGGVSDKIVDSGYTRPAPKYDDINQYTNTSSKIDSRLPGQLTDFITLKNQAKPEIKDKIDEIDDKDEFEKDLLNPGKNFLDILDLMLSPDAILEPLTMIEDIKDKPSIQKLKDLIMDRNKKQIQLSIMGFMQI